MKRDPRTGAAELPASALEPRIAARALPFVRIRWRIFSFLFFFGFIAYVQQRSITIAAERIMPDLHVSQFQIGLLEQAFVIGYAAFQLPGGLLGQAIGARRTFILIGLLAFLAMAATAAAPAVFAGQTVFIALLAAQLLLGTSQAAIFPVSAGVFADWFPPSRWAFVQGLQTMGLQLGAAATPPVVAALMLRLGWQQAMFWISAPALAGIAAWARYARNTPREHSGVSAAELAEIGPRPVDEAAGRPGRGRVLAVLADRNVLLLFGSYLCMNYVFYLLANWVFLYLIQERHFSVLESGFLATAPPLAAAFGAGIGGVLTSALCAGIGNRWGYRLVPLIALPTAGVSLLVAVHAGSPYAAVAALAACYGAVELTEAAYWGTAMTVGGSDTMTVSGIMNTGGNLGGILGIPIVAYLSGHHAWNTAFLVGVGFALASASAWFLIDPNRRVAAGIDRSRERADLASR
jgi:ACS family glucarate transporter-like MFS transporter